MADGGGGGVVNWVVSVDDHVVEPPDLWERWLPARHRDRGPRLARDDEGEAWFYDGRRMPTNGLSVVAGKGRDEFDPGPVTYDEMRPGCYDSGARIADMDRDGVLASLCFPSVPRFCGQLFHEGSDKELGYACLRAYNDWMIEEWAGAAPGRFIPLNLIPLWDPALAAKEMERCAAKGGKAIAFSENPAELGLPSLYDRDRYWDPVLAAADDLGMPICAHIGSSSTLPSTAPDCPLVVSVMLAPLNMMRALADWLFSGVLPRFPGLKVCLSEGGIGWIPAALERAEHTFETQMGWASKADWDLRATKARAGTGAGGELVPPRELFRRHVYGCYIAGEDDVGLANLDAIGADHVMVETDYPHSDSSWPDTQRLVARDVAGLAPADAAGILRENALRVFGFEAADPATLGPAR